MADGEPPIGGGPNLGTPRRGRGNRSFTNINAKVSVDGLKDMASALKEIAGYTKQIRQNFEAINTAGRSGGSVWSRIMGRGQGGALNNSMGWMSNLPSMQQRGPTSQVGGAAPPAGTAPTQQAAPAATPGSGGSTMPWMSRLGVAATVGAGILSSRISRNIAESTPILAQSSLLSSMYSGIGPYNQVEMQRFRDLGRYGGTRQEQAQTQAMALRFGQTPQQAGQFMQGVGTFTQAMGGTMTSPQVAQATGGFLDPMVLRRQRAQGMQYARVGGQVRNPGQIAQDYIKNYEQRRNGGVKLNEFDFINLQTPGHPLRITFGRLYGLGDESIDLISTVGMQTVQQGGQLNYNSEASVAAMGMDRSRLGGAAAALGTTRGRREASFAQQNEGGMVTQLRMEQTLQEALTGVEDAASGLTSTFAALDRVIQGATTGLAMLLGGGAMMGMAGARGGGGLLGRVLGGAGAAAAAGAPGAGAPGAAAAGGGMGMLGKGMLGVGGAVAGIGAIKTAVNARSMGDIFSAGAQGAVSGAMIGGMFGMPLVGAAGGFVFAAGAAGISALMGNAGEAAQEDRVTSSIAGTNLTDQEIIEKVRDDPNSRGFNARSAWYSFRDNDNPELNGLIDRYQVRRSALIAQWMEAAANRDPVAFEKFLARREGLGKGDKTEIARDWNEILGKFSEFANKSDGTVNDQDYVEWGKKLIDISENMRFPRERGKYPGSETLNDIYNEFFGGLSHPMLVEPVYTEANYSVMDQYSTSLSAIATASVSGQQGDPEDTETESSTLNFSSVNNMPMAPEPQDDSWTGMHPTMKKRLRALFAASKGLVRWENGGGTRTEAEQKALFLSRYRPDPNGEVEWQGKKWKRFTGAAAAPPGRSMHEIGLAADLGGAGVGNGWLKKNAKRFGLKEFSNVNSEPWHVQPAELPNSRRQYEDQGASWGGGGGPDEEGATDPAVESADGGGGGFAGGASGLGGSSLGTLGMGTSSLGVLSGGGGGGGGRATFQGTAGATTADMSADVDYSGEGPLTGKQVAQMLYNQGFRGDNLIMALAISKRESGWDPGAFNGNSNTGDKSYGLFQINMIGELGPARREQYGLTENEELFDPKTNIKAAYMLSSNGTNFHHWGGYKGMEDNYNTDMSGARSIVSSMGLGDAVFDTGVGTGGLTLPSGGVGRSPMSRLMGGNGGQPLNVHVTIQSNGNYAYDAKQLAKHVRPAFEAEYAEVSAKRNM